jgi:uncharacterized membrane protein
MSRLIALGIGAAVMYFCDPNAGRKRRNDFRNQVNAANRRLQNGKEVLIRDASNRTHGMLVETRNWVEKRRQGDSSATLPPITQIASNIAAPWMGGNWSPTQRASAGALGAGMAAYGYLRGGLKGMIYAVLGGALFARATTNQELAKLGGGQGILIEKTIHIAAPVEQVFAYWRNLENMPQWMSHVREVRYQGGDRYHWVVDGPAGAPVEWDSELLNVVENREMTWRSVEGSQVDNTGRVRFEPDNEGSRIIVQLRYMPPGGVIGHVVAKAFGVDPKSHMDDDLNRMKSTIERGKPPHDSAAQRRLGTNGASPA